MKKKHFLIGLGIALIAVLAAGCATSGKSASPVKTSQTKHARKHAKHEHHPAKKDDSNDDQSAGNSNESNQDSSQAQTGQTQNNNQTAGNQNGSAAGANGQTAAGVSEAAIIRDVISRMGYPSNYNASDFNIMQNGDQIDVAENHDSAHMKAAGAFPGVSPVIAHYQVLDGHLYYLNPADNSRQAVN